MKYNLLAMHHCNIFKIPNDKELLIRTEFPHSITVLLISLVLDYLAINNIIITSSKFQMMNNY